ncbi:RHS repeat-associated core domain-containing protein, partial [Flavobacteriaceae bacterium]|nr:RHS repeat-associated core domain-containing protein [Flavobacteriaceae bacterium]
LGNVRAVIMKNGENAVSLTAKTDYYPFGMPMPNRNIEGNYRYKFQGQEKDPETGKEAFELRLWDGRIGRWLTVDPAGQYSSPYLGMGNNPITRIDPDGGKDGDSSCCPGDCCPNTTGVQELPEVVIGGSSGGNSGFDFSGMPNWMQSGQPDWWNTSFTGNLSDYNNDFGTDYTEGNQLNQWRYQNHYKPEYDDMISSIHGATNQAADLAMYILPTGLGVQVGTKVLPVLGRYAFRGYRYVKVIALKIDAIVVHKLTPNSIKILSSPFSRPSIGYSGQRALIKNFKGFVHTGRYIFNNPESIYTSNTVNYFNRIYTDGSRLKTIIKSMF